jgi:predicted DNA-binding mobile mystery protein A
MNSHQKAGARANLDARFRALGAPETFTRPAHGWIRAIREALGMTTRQFAQRIGVRLSSAQKFEKSEVDGTIELATLRRAAAALDCTVVYFLVPNKPLEDIVRNRAREIVMKQLAPIEHSMALEDQRAKASPRLVEDLIRELEPRRLWDGQ